MPNESSMYIDSDTKIQVLDTISELPRAEKEQCAAFIVRTFNRNFRLDTTHSHRDLVHNDSETNMSLLCGPTVLKISYRFAKISMKR